MMVGLFISGRLITFDLIELGRTKLLTGTQIGTSCGSLVFEDGGGDFMTAAAPYNGSFRPFGDVFIPGQNFDVFRGMAANGTWELPFYRLDAPVTVQCFRLELTVANAP